MKFKFKYCQYCGAKLNIDAKFCPKCGKEQTKQAEPNQSTHPIHNQYNYQNAYKPVPPTQPTYATPYGNNNVNDYKVRITPPACTMGEAWSAYWHQYAKGHGYSSRSEFWKMGVWNAIIVIVLLLFTAIWYGVSPSTVIIPILFIILYAIIAFVPSTALEIRRMRDAGASDGTIISLLVWSYILAVVTPFLKFIPILYIVCYIVSSIISIVFFVYNVLPSVRYSRN